MKLPKDLKNIPPNNAGEEWEIPKPAPSPGEQK